MRRRDRGGWWIFVAMAAAALVGLPLAAWIGRGIEAARGVAGWEWRLEGLRRVREARARLEAGHDPETIDLEGGEAGGGQLSVALERGSDADLDPDRARIAWVGPEGTVFLMADFSADFSDNVRLHHPEILAIPRGASSEGAVRRWGRDRAERLQQREARIESWREIASGGIEEGALAAVAGSDPGFLCWLAGSFGNRHQRRGRSPSARGRTGSDRCVEDGDADESEGYPPVDPVRAGPGGEHPARGAVARVVGK